MNQNQGFHMIEDKQLLQFYVNLTPRQREVLQLVSEGCSNQEVAERLCIASSVVAGHLTNIYDELVALKTVGEARPGRYVLIRWFGLFFQQHPELDNFASEHA